MFNNSFSISKKTWRFCVTEICRKIVCIKITVTCNELHTKPVKILDDIPVTDRYSRHSV